MSEQEIHNPTRVTASELIALHREAGNLPLTASAIHAHLGGQYLSAFKGRGMEFDEVRPYLPGDDVRSIDWRVTARSGKPHTKLYREERERPVLIWLDLRRSMFFGSRNYFKSVLASRVASLLAWSTAQHGDRLGGLVFSEHLHEEIRPRRGKSATLNFIHRLVDHPAWDNHAEVTDNDSGLEAINRLRRVARPGSLIFLVSDFHGIDHRAHASLSQLARHNDVVMLFINDPLERQLPPNGWYRLTDGMKEIAIDTAQKKYREDYAQRFMSHEQFIKNLCQKLKLFYLPVSTDAPLLASLQKGLGLRKVS